MAQDWLKGSNEGRGKVECRLSKLVGEVRRRLLPKGEDVRRRRADRTKLISAWTTIVAGTSRGWRRIRRLAAESGGRVLLEAWEVSLSGLGRAARFLSRSWHTRRGRLTVLAAAAALALAALAYGLVAPNAVLVKVGGQPIGVARSAALVRQAVDDLQTELAAQGWVRPENHSHIELTPIRAAKEQVLGPDMLKARLREALAFNVRAVAVQINGRPVLWLRDRATAERVVAAVRDAFASRGGGKVVKVAVEETVEFVEGEVKTTEVVSPEDAVEWLKKGVPRSQTYVVAAGDSFWSIARAHGLTVEQLKEANPHIKGDFLQIGDELNLVKAQPLLHVVVVRQVEEQRAIPYPVKVQSDSSLYRGQEKVKQEGQPGLKVSTYRVVERNGVVVAKEELGTKVLREPVPKVVARGTRRLVLASRGEGSGALAWPVYGEITSGYGYRGREFHGGIDIGAPYGAPVRAAASGIVIYAGRDGGYGRTVVIDHGGGLVTRYAHLSSIHVEAGERVERGEQIGTVGETGRATGPHLHFEVIVNGSTRNPLNYLR